ncbi:interleukin-11, partial [Oxyura jamaicensis]|uniref:interleukin-11 n=1 Tax=Oxyura jamaicensis TaxID=8884 RepID=UPI0015A51144
GALRPLEPELGALQARLDRLLRRIDHLPRPPPAPLPPPGSPWAAVQASHAVFHGLHLYLDWASRALLLLRNRL